MGLRYSKPALEFVNVVNKVVSERKKKNLPQIIINYSWCKRCGICIAFCPTGVYTADELGTPIISFPDKCINCKLCVLRCPDFAIELKDEDKDKAKDKK